MDQAGSAVHTAAMICLFVLHSSTQHFLPIARARCPNSRRIFCRVKKVTSENDISGLHPAPEFQETLRGQVGHDIPPVQATSSPPDKSQQVTTFFLHLGLVTISAAGMHSNSFTGLCSDVFRTESLIRAWTW